MLWHCGMCETTWDDDSPKVCANCESDEIEPRAEAVAWRGEIAVTYWERRAEQENAKRVAWLAACVTTPTTVTR